MQDFVSGRPSDPPPDPVTGQPKQPSGGAPVMPKQPPELERVHEHAARVREAEEARRAKASGFDLPKFFTLESAWRAECALVRDLGERRTENRAALAAARTREADVRRAHRDWASDPAALLTPELAVRIRQLEEEGERLRIEWESASARAASLGSLVGRLRDFLKTEGVLG